MTQNLMSFSNWMYGKMELATFISGLVYGWLNSHVYGDLLLKAVTSFVVAVVATIGTHLTKVIIAKINKNKNKQTHE